MDLSSRHLDEVVKHAASGRHAEADVAFTAWLSARTGGVDNTAARHSDLVTGLVAAGNTNLIRRALFKLGLFVRSSNRNRARVYFELAARLPLSPQDTSLAAYCHLNLASIAIDAKDPDSVLDNTRRAREVGGQLSDASVECAALRYEARAYEMRGDLASTERSWRLATAAVERCNDRREAGRIHYDYAQFLEQTNRRRDAEAHLRRALGLFAGRTDEEQRKRAALLLLASYGMTRNPARSILLLWLGCRVGVKAQDTDALVHKLEQGRAFLEHSLVALESDQGLRWLARLKQGRLGSVPFEQRTAHEQGLILELGEAIERAPDVATKNMIRQRLQEALAIEAKQSTHSEAYFVLLACIGLRRPYALYLRNFGSESRVARFQHGGQITSYIIPQRLEREVESRLALSIAPFLPLVAIANPDDAYPDHGGIPRLDIPDGAWEGVVEKAVQQAHVIFIWIRETTPGVCFEVETIRRLGREHSTVVIVDDAARKVPEDSTVAGFFESLVALAEQGGVGGVSGARIAPGETRDLPSLDFAGKLPADAIPSSPLDDPVLRVFVEGALAIEGDKQVKWPSSD